MKTSPTGAKSVAFVRSAALGATALCLGSFGAAAANLSRTIEVSAPPAAVWSAIGAFCAIKDWLPPVGMCIEDGKTPSTRTLVTKDGKAAFVEKQTARSDAEYSYSYTFLSSPLPVTNYTSTITVTANGNQSIVEWRGAFYRGHPGNEPPPEQNDDAAVKAITGVYQSGLANLKKLAEGG
jgi:uncharacterized protein YndB with AHSA1/START domain